MATTNSNAPAQRRFAGKSAKVKNKQDPFAQFLSMGNFLIALGLLFTATGVICYIPFHNKFSKLILAVGLAVSIFGFAVRVLDLCIKIVKDR